MNVENFGFQNSLNFILVHPVSLTQPERLYAFDYIINFAYCIHMTTFHLEKPIQLVGFELWPLRWQGVELSSKGVSGLERFAFSELDNPNPNLISVFNPNEFAVLLPLGTIVGGLLQTRMIADSQLVPENSEIEIEVLCVEKGRFDSFQEAQLSGRAPLSVIASGREQARISGTWIRGALDRQQAVWSAVSRHENRSGFRPTSSLRQIMAEDLQDQVRHRLVQEAVDQRLDLGACNGYVLCAEGEPVLLEAFSQGASIQPYVGDLVKGASFDFPELEYSPTARERVQHFLDLLELESFFEQGSTNFDHHVANSSRYLECHFTLDNEKKLAHAYMLNRNHRALQEA